MSSLRPPRCRGRWDWLRPCAQRLGLLLAAGHWLPAFPPAASAQNLIPNGSFEDAASVAASWISGAGGTFGTQSGHTGRHCLTGSSSQGAVIWESQPIPLQAREEYRLDAWMRCPTGAAKLGADLLDAQGHRVRRIQLPTLRQARDFRYVAREWNAASASSVRLWFWVKGQAELDDVSVALVATGYLGNKGLDGDARGRIPFWSEERHDPLLPGRRAGSFRFDSEIKRQGTNS